MMNMGLCAIHQLPNEYFLEDQKLEKLKLQKICAECQKNLVVPIAFQDYLNSLENKKNTIIKNCNEKQEDFRKMIREVDQNVEVILKIKTKFHYELLSIIDLIEMKKTNLMQLEIRSESELEEFMSTFNNLNFTNSQANNIVLNQLKYLEAELSPILNYFKTKIQDLSFLPMNLQKKMNEQNPPITIFRLNQNASCITSNSSLTKLFVAFRNKIDCYLQRDNGFWLLQTLRLEQDNIVNISLYETQNLLSSYDNNNKLILLEFNQQKQIWQNALFSKKYDNLTFSNNYAYRKSNNKYILIFSIDQNGLHFQSLIEASEKIILFSEIIDEHYCACSLQSKKLEIFEPILKKWMLYQTIQFDQEIAIIKFVKKNCLLISFQKSSTFDFYISLNNSKFQLRYKVEIHQELKFKNLNFYSIYLFDQFVLSIDDFCINLLEYQMQNNQYKLIKKVQEVKEINEKCFAGWNDVKKEIFVIKFSDD